jgi:hypothetical protein
MPLLYFHTLVCVEDGIQISIVGAKHCCKALVYLDSLAMLRPYYTIWGQDHRGTPHGSAFLAIQAHKFAARHPDLSALKGQQVSWCRPPSL